MESSSVASSTRRRDDRRRLTQYYLLILDWSTVLETIEWSRKADTLRLMQPHNSFGDKFL